MRMRASFWSPPFKINDPTKIKLRVDPDQLKSTEMIVQTLSADQCSAWMGAHKPVAHRRAALKEADFGVSKGDTAGLQSSRTSMPCYFDTLCWVGVTMLAGADSEIENVSQVFQPDGLFAALNSPYPFSPRKA